MNPSPAPTSRMGPQFLAWAGAGLLVSSVAAITLVLYQLGQVQTQDETILRRIAEEQACDALFTNLASCEDGLAVALAQSMADRSITRATLVETWQEVQQQGQEVRSLADVPESRELLRQLDAGLGRITWFHDGSGDVATQIKELKQLQSLVEHLQEISTDQTTALSHGLVQKNHRILALVTILGVSGLTVLGVILLVAYRRQDRVMRHLAEREALLQAIIEHCQDAIVTLDADHGIISFNKAAERIFGWTAAEVMGSSLDRLIPMERRAAHRGHLQAYFVSTTVPLTMAPGRRVLAVHRDGRQFPITSSLSRISVAGRLLATAVIRDHTEDERVLEDLRRSRDAALAAQVAKSELLAVVSHEIRTPLTGVLGMLRQARRAPELPVQLRDRLDIAQRSAESMHQILNDTLDLARLEATRLELQCVPVALVNELRQCHGLFAAQADEHGLAYSLALAPGIPHGVLADPLRLRQVVSNLLGNAIKFTRNGAVTLAATAEPGSDGRTMVTIAVRDTGIGMSAEALDRIFQPFAQADAGTAQHFGGSGLGLSIVKRLVELMGGRIEVASVADRGTTFTVTLSLEICAPPMRGHLSDRFRTRQSPVGTVLIVDDEPANRMVVGGLLGEQGITVVEAGNGAECLAERFRLGRDVAAILMDLGLPDMDGVAVLNRLRAAELAADLPPVPVIVLSGTIHPEGPAHWQRLGFADALTKPVAEADLLAALQFRTSDPRPASGTPAAAPRTPAAVPRPSSVEIMVLDMPHVALLRRRGMLEPLIAVFSTSLTERLDALAQRPGDADQLHALSGAAATVGLQRLAKEAQEMEHRVRQGQPVISEDIRVLEILAQQGLADLRRPPTA